jgi:hypothetical protein
MTNNQSSIIDNQFKRFIQIAGSAQIAVSFQNRASSIKHRASSMQNKPNSPIVHLNLIYLLIMIYTISTCLTKVKNKPNTNPITESPKMCTKPYNTLNYENLSHLPGKKTNPNQSQYKACPRMSLSGEQFSKFIP